MNYKSLLPVIILFLMGVNANSQTCILDIGGKNTETIVKTFQLNAEQKTVLEMLIKELSEQRQSQEKEVAQLFETHPQSTPDELLILARKHKALEETMLETTIQYDQKLITLFNEKQYERYFTLCTAANRTPIAKLEE